MKKLRFLITASIVLLSLVFAGCSNPAANDIINGLLPPGQGTPSVTFTGDKSVYSVGDSPVSDLTVTVTDASGVKTNYTSADFASTVTVTPDVFRLTGDNQSVTVSVPALGLSAIHNNITVKAVNIIGDDDTKCDISKSEDPAHVGWYKVTLNNGNSLAKSILLPPDFTNLKVSSDGDNITVTYDTSVPGDPGSQEVSIVTADKLDLSGITVTTLPTTIVYFAGDTLDLTGLVVTAHYNNADDATVTGWTSVPADGTKLNTVGEQTVIVSYTENGNNASTSFDVTVKDLTQNGISLSGPSKTIYNWDDTNNALDLKGLKVYATFNNDTVGTKELSGWTTTPEAGTLISENTTVTVTCGDFSATFDVTYNDRAAPTPTGIEVTPSVLSYKYYDKFDSSALTVYETFDYGDNVLLNIGDGDTGWKTNIANGTPLTSDGNVKVTYKNFEKAVNFTVAPPILTDITLSGDYKTEYKEGESLDLSGLVVTASYDNSAPSIPGVSGYTTDPAAGTVLGTEDKSVEVSYTENGITKTKTFEITVTESPDKEIASYEAMFSPQDFVDGNRDLKKGINVYAIYSDNSRVLVGNPYDDLVGIDPALATDDQSVTFSYQDTVLTVVVPYVLNTKTTYTQITNIQYNDPKNNGDKTIVSSFTIQENWSNDKTSSWNQYNSNGWTETKTTGNPPVATNPYQFGPYIIWMVKGTSSVVTPTITGFVQ